MLRTDPSQVQEIGANRRPSSGRPVAAAGRTAPTLPVVPGPRTKTGPAADAGGGGADPGTGQRVSSLALAALASALESVGSLGYAVAVVLAGRAGGGGAPLSDVAGLVVVFVVVGLGLVAVTVGLWRVRRVAQAPAAAVHVVLVLVAVTQLPAGWAVAVPLLVVAGGGLAALFVRPTREALGRPRLPGR